MPKEKTTALCLLLCCTVLWSCKQHALTPHYKQTVFDSALIYGNRGQAPQAFELVNSHFASFPYVSVIDRFRYYQFEYDLYNSYYSPLYDPLFALHYADSMVWLLQVNDLTAESPAQYAFATNCQGQIYIQLKRYPEAFLAFSLCRMLAAKAGDTCMVSKYNSTIATVRFRQAQYPEAIELYKRSLTEEGACKVSNTEYHDMQGNLDNIALAYNRIGQTDSAILYCDKAIDYIVGKRRQYTQDSIFPDIALGVVYGNEALAMQQKGDLSGAELLLKKALAINTLPGHDLNSATIDQIYLAQLYLLTKRQDSAFAFLRASGGHLPPGEEGIHKQWLSSMSSYYEAMGDKRMAIQYLKKTLELSDSIAAKDRYQYTTNEDNVYQLVEAKYTIDLLQKSNTIKGMSLIIAGMLVFMVGTFTILIRKNLKRHKHMLAELTVKQRAIVRQQAQLQHILAELDQKNKEKDRILQVVAHDLRSPIAGIKMMAGLILGKDESRQAEMLGLIKSGAGACLDLTNELLDETFNSDSIHLTRSLVDLKHLISESAQLMQFGAAKKGQVILTDLPDETRFVVADAGKLGRVFNNLIGNAIKFSYSGDEILVMLEEKESTYRISILDHGIGIPAEEQTMVFDTFTSSRRPGTQGERSFGFGLSISKHIVEAHGGTLSFFSEEGHGSEFFIDLPFASGHTPMG
jgi:two-component system sensor histidine kinase VicK